MFGTHEKIVAKTKFQKPNILRKKPPKTKPSVETSNDSDIVGTPLKIDSSPTDWIIERRSKHKCSKSYHAIKKATPHIKLDTYLSVGNSKRVQPETTAVIAEERDTVNTQLKTSIDCEVDCEKVSSTSITSSEVQYLNLQEALIEIYEGPTLDKEASVTIASSCANNSQPKLLISNETGLTLQNSELTNTLISKTNGFLTIPYMIQPCETLPENQSEVYVCDVSQCNIFFTDKNKLKKHKATHKRHDGSPAQHIITCPAKNKCTSVFSKREDVLKHLKAEHTLDEALYSCERCSRRFFWASGVRIHARSCGGERRAARAPLVCPWTGCGRAFSQPCRLKEHSRAHTGDKPYPCHYQGCGWSFRTASKLLRHSRRHTGDRRHHCDACGRKFLRAEHLRHHVTRHAAPHAARAPRPPRVRPVAARCPDFQQPLPEPTPFSHQVKEELEPEVNPQPASQAPHAPSAFIKMESDCSEGEDPFMVASRRSPLNSAASVCARTHRPWPLTPTDVQVELSEGSESNTYTIRSDLFLQGLDDDSESGPALLGRAALDEDVAGAVGVAGGTALLHDADIGLLEHSAIDLMQDELLYTDVAVGESSFHVLLLNDEQLN